MRRRRVLGQRGQSLVEFSLTVGLLMLLIVLTAQVAIYLHYRDSLDTAAREGAFQAALAGHTPADGRRSTLAMWAELEPSGGAIQVDVRRQGNLVVVTANGSAPAVLPIPAPPFRSLPLSARAVHTIEQFQRGSS